MPTHGVPLAQAFFGAGMMVACQLLLLLGLSVAGGVRPPLGSLLPPLLQLVFDPEACADRDDHAEEAW